MEQKSEIRRIARNVRTALPESIRKRYSEQIVSHIIQHPFFQECDTVCCYVAFKGEADISMLMDAAWAAKKRVVVPKVLTQETMEFFTIHSRRELSPGAFGILEPEDDKEPWCAGEEERVLILLPGLAFDREGNRLGYGGGYYDRYLKSHPSFHTIGIAFSVQCLENIPAQPHDQKTEIVITEKGIYKS